MEPELRRYRSSYDLTQCGTYESGRFRSQWYRGFRRQMEWLRLCLDGPEQFHVRVYVCDTRPEDFREAEAAQALERMANDLLLYGVRGQYLSFTVEPAEQLRGFTLAFPGRSIVEGLPNALQGDETLRTLLAVYQSGYIDINAQMREFVSRLDSRRPNALPQLSRWIGAGRWTMDPAVTPKILPHAPLLARLRGTRRGLLLLAKLITGYDCQVVEGWRLDKLGRERADIQRLYGASGETITVLVPAQASREDVELLRALLPDFIPLGAPYSLIHLEDGAPMDGYSYLDENTILTEQAACELDGPETDEVILE